MLFAVASAVVDAGIAVGAAKIHYDYVRPITAVRWLRSEKKVRGWAGPGLGTRVIEGDRWVPNQRTEFPYAALRRVHVRTQRLPHGRRRRPGELYRQRCLR